MGHRGAVVGEGFGCSRPIGRREAMAPREKVMETTAYCSCGKCCCWEYGMMVTPYHYLAAQPALPFVKLAKRRRNPHYHSKDQKSFIFDRYWTATSLKGCAYEGKTADGDLPRQSRPGPFHPRSFRKPLRLALRAAFAPWFLLGRRGTIAADLNEYPFGTRMYVPGYGWGLVSMNESCHERQTD